MAVKGWFNVSCDALECSAMGEGNHFGIFGFSQAPVLLKENYSYNRKKQNQKN